MNTSWDFWHRLATGILLCSAVESAHAAWIDADASTATVTKTIETTYDVDGNPIRMLVNQKATRADGVISTMTTLGENTYYPQDLSNWIIGKLDTSKATHTQGGSVIVKTSKLIYDPSTWAVSQEVNEPSKPDYKIVTSYIRDNWGNVTNKTVKADFSSDPKKKVTETSFLTAYDPVLHIFPITQTNPLGHTTSRSFDYTSGLLLSETDINGLTSKFQYDAFGRLIASLGPDSNKVLTTYISCEGDINCPSLAKFAVKTVTVKDPDNSLPVGNVLDLAGTPISPESYSYFDSLRRELISRTQSVDGRWVISGQRELNNKGQVVRSADPYFQGVTSQQWTYFYYDDYGRIVKVTQPKGTSTTIAYGQLKTTYTNELNQIRVVENGLQGKPIKITEGYGTTSSSNTKYTYDALGAILTVQDVAGKVRKYTYDEAGRKITDLDPNQGSWSYAYDSLGRLVSQTDQKGQTTEITYDSIGRVVKRKAPDFNSQWIFDTALNGKGKLSEAAASNGYSRTHSYDAFGRSYQTTTKVDGVSYSINSSYDSSGRIKSITYPTGFSYQNEYSAQGFLTKVKSEDGQRIYWQVSDAANGSDFDAAGRVLKATLGNGVVVNRSFDSKTGQLSAQWSGSNSGVYNDVQNEVYLFNDAGNLQSRADYINNLSETFQYDSLNRLISAAVLGQTAQSIKYDNVGNITFKSDVGYYRYDGAHPQAVSVVCRSAFSADGSCGAPYSSYSYDGNGNVVSGGGRDYTWSSFNKPLSLSRSGKVESFAYDADYERIKHIQTDGSISLYINPRLDSGAHFEMRKKGSTIEYTHHVYAGGEAVAAIVTLDTGAEINKYNQNFTAGTDGIALPGAAADPAGVFIWSAAQKKLTINTINYATSQLPTASTNISLPVSEGVKLKVDVDVGVNSSIGERYFSVGLDNIGGQTFGTNGLRDIRAVFAGNKVYAQRTVRDAAGKLLQNSSREMGSLADGSVYTLEIEAHDTGTNIYVYPLNTSRSQGYVYKTLLPDMVDARLTISGRAGVEYGASAGSIDNISLSVGGIQIGKAAPYERYLHKDHLGSVVAVTDNQGQVVERFSYDAWGKRRKLDGLSDSAFDLSGTGSLLGKSTHHGFTGHEMLDDMTLVHMNGRIYDPVIGRFISADPNIDTLYSTQGLNSYSYVLNNPLNATDPSGYFSLKKAIKKLGHSVGKAFQAIRKVAEAPNRAIDLALGPKWSSVKVTVGSMFCGWAYFICYGAGSYDRAHAFGASTSESLRIGAINGATALVAQGISYGIGTLTTTTTSAGVTLKMTTGQYAANVGMHAVTGGAMSEALGGDFRTGFITGGIGAAAAPYTPNAYVSAAIGGAVSVISGGDFASGAIVAFVGYRFNAEEHKPTGKAALSLGDALNDQVASAGGRWSPDEAKLVFGKDLAGSLPQLCQFSAICVAAFQNSALNGNIDSLRPTIGAGPVEFSDPGSYIFKQSVYGSICASRNAAACNFHPGPGQTWADRPAPWVPDLAPY